MTDYRSLNHTKWACQYHVVFIPKYRKKVIRAVSTPLRQPDSAFTVAPQAGDERGRAIVTDGL